jgi:hypothetical protein
LFFAATATGNKTNPLAVAHIYFENIFRFYGLCDAFVSDCDSSFVSAFWQELHSLCGTSLFMSTAHHPQSNGLTGDHTVLTTLN